jgi:hypothetical protein
MHRCGVEDPSLIWKEVKQLGIKNWGNKCDVPHCLGMEMCLYVYFHLQ